MPARQLNHADRRRFGALLTASAKFTNANAVVVIDEWTDVQGKPVMTLITDCSARPVRADRFSRPK